MFILLESLYPKKCFFQNKFDTCFFNFYTLFKVLNNKIMVPVIKGITEKNELYFIKLSADKWTEK
jgi:hypothetical protein